MQDTVAEQLLAIRQQLGEIQATVNLMRDTTSALDDRVKVIEESAKRRSLMEWLGTDTGRKIGAALSLVVTAVAGYVVGLIG